MKKMFFTMIGPEQRVLGFFEKTHKIEIDNYIFLINKEYKTDTRVVEYKKMIFEKLKNQKDRISLIETSYINSLELVKQFNQFIKNNKINLENHEIHLDISTFNRQNLLTMLYLLRHKNGINNITCYYTIPKETNEKISKCARNYSTIPLLGGKQSIDKNKLLLLLVGFEFDRARYLWEKVEPSKTIIAIGDKPTDNRFLSINKKVVSGLKEMINCEEINISAKDPFVAQQDIENIIRKYRKNYNIVIAPMNTKIQTLGLYLAWEKYPDIQIVYSCPEKFSEWLTKGINRTVTFEIGKK